MTTSAPPPPGGLLDQDPLFTLSSAASPASPSAKRAGAAALADERWGWPWMASVVRSVRPRYVVVENVAALLDDADAFGWLLGDLAHLGFDAQWSVLSACAMGAPHTRERLFVLAYPAGERIEQLRGVERTAQGEAQRHVHHWAAQPEPHRVADGVPRRVDRNRALGNAVVPAVGEHIGRLIMSADLAAVGS